MSSDTHQPAVRIEREESYRFRIRFGSDFIPDLVTDEPPPLGQGLGPNPAMMLAAAVGNCLASSLLFCLGKARLEVGSLEASVRVTTARNPEGRLRIRGLEVRLMPSVTPEVGQKMARCLELFDSFCVVTESVREGIPVGVEVRPQVIRPAGVPAGALTNGASGPRFEG